MMEDPIIPVSVKAMMGRFENVTNHPRNYRSLHSKGKAQRENLDGSMSQSSVCLEKNNDHFKQISNESDYEDKIRYQNKKIAQSYDDLGESNSNKIEQSGLINDKLLGPHHPLYENVNDSFYNKQKNEGLLTIENRSRSHSVGSLLSHHDEFEGNERSHSNNLNSFTDKQKLVESIVKNIKNSSQNCKETKSSNKNKSTAPLITSKLEKDLRNALEKGVRKLSVRKGKNKDKTPELTSKSISSPIEITHNSYKDSLKQLRIDKDVSSGNQNYCLNTIATYPISSDLSPTCPVSVDDRSPMSLDDHSSSVLINDHPPSDLHDSSLSLGSHCPRPAYSNSLREPIRPPRRKSPKKINSEKSEPMMKTKPLRQNVDPLYNSISDLRFNSLSPLSDSIEPPKKPPRTFAHDIYMSTKVDERSRFQNRPLPEPTERIPLNQEQIDALYSKPIKIPKAKSNDHDTTSYLKPEIAPKPSSLVNSEATKRFSIVDESSLNSKEFSEAKKSAVKRNSSFRFSFRKPKKTSTYLGYSQPQPASPKKDPRFANFTNTFQRKKDDCSKNVTFSQRSKSDEVLYDDDRIYATPHEDLQNIPDEPELHYMCSPLFVEDEDWSTDSDDVVPVQTNYPKDSSRKKKKAKDFRVKFGLDGLKQEWRQSYRFVQKRFKALSPPDKKM